MKLELIFLTILINLTKQRNLIFVLTHFRHGARAPIAPSDDPYDYFNKSWNNPSQLTGVGHRMHYILGLHNRERYIMNEDTKLLDESCNLHDILIMSTNFNRTINSALAQLYGLYPEETKQITEKQKLFANPPINVSKNIQNQIEYLNNNNQFLPHSLNFIPIHIFHNSEHRIKEFENPSCTQVANEIMKKNIDNEEIKKQLNIFTSNYSEYFKKYLPNIKNYDYHIVEKLADQFITDKTEGHDFADFKKISEINDEDFDKLNDFFLEFAGKTMKDYQYGDSEGKLIRIDMSPFFNELVEYIQKRVNLTIKNITLNQNDYSSPKLVMVSGHDSTLTSMMLFLELMYKDKKKTFYRNPIYASNAAFEVYIKDNANLENLNEDSFEIEYYFNGEKIDTFNFIDFKERVKKEAYTPEKIGEICKYQNSSNECPKNDSTSSTTLVIFIILTIILAIIVIILFIFILKKKGVSSSNIEKLTI